MTLLNLVVALKWQDCSSNCGNRRQKNRPIVWPLPKINIGNERFLSMKNETILSNGQWSLRKREFFCSLTFFTVTILMHLLFYVIYCSNFFECFISKIDLYSTDMWHNGTIINELLTRAMLLTKKENECSHFLHSLISHL